MISVVIYINNQPIVLKSARNMGHIDKGGFTEYMDESGNIIKHRRGNGAVQLAKRLLDEWVEPEYQNDV